MRLEVKKCKIGPLLGILIGMQVSHSGGHRRNSPGKKALGFDYEKRGLNRSGK
jgi:hypothetical protein